MDQEILDILTNYDRDLDAYRRGDKASRLWGFMGKKGYQDHLVLPTNDGSVVIGPRGELAATNQYLVKYPNNGYYIGPLRGQFRHGFGYRTYADPDLIYAGEYVNNLKSGKGRLWSRKENRWVYDGSWANDMKNGYGEMWKNGVTYKGSWVNDKLEGVGRMDWPSGQVFEGQFANDLRNGDGTMTFPNGDQYVGGWRNGRPHGKGYYQWNSGEVYNGTWTDGIMDGSGEIDYGIPVKGMGSVRMGSVKELNFQVQRPEDWQAGVGRSSQFIKSFRETIVPDALRPSLRAEMTSAVGTAGFGGRAAPANINYSYAGGVGNTGVRVQTSSPISAVSTVQSTNQAASIVVPGNIGATGVQFGSAQNYGGGQSYQVSTVGPVATTQVQYGGSNLQLGGARQGALVVESNTAQVGGYEFGGARREVAYGAPSTERHRVDIVPSSIGYGTDKVETRVVTTKTAPTGTYNNNPVDYIDPRRAAQSKIGTNYEGTYQVSTDPVLSRQANVVTTTVTHQDAVVNAGENRGFFGKIVDGFKGATNTVTNTVTGAATGVGNAVTGATNTVSNTVTGKPLIGTTTTTTQHPNNLVLESNSANIRVARTDLAPTTTTYTTGGQYTVPSLTVQRQGEIAPITVTQTTRTTGDNRVTLLN